MELTSFILGVCAVIVLMMVVGTLVNYMTTMSLKKEINGLQKEVENLYRDLETKERQLYDFGNNLDQNLRDELQKLYRHIDSRVDKTNTGVSQQIADIYRQLDKLENEGKSVING
jgi:DNA phosphorothioation-dependent restriction protein DptG